MASITDKITKTMDGQNPNVTTAAGERSPGSTELQARNLDGWPQDTAVHFTTYRQDSQGEPVEGSQTDWKGIVNRAANTIVNLKRVGGVPDQGNSTGDIIEANPTASWANDLGEAMLEVHNPDGTLKDSIVAKDNIAAKAVTKEKLADKAVTAEKIDFSTTLLGYKERTQSFHIQGTTPVAIPELVAEVTIPAGVKKVKVEAYSPILYSDQPSVAATIAIWKGDVNTGTRLQEGRGFQSGGSGTGSPTVSRVVSVTPGESTKFSVSLQNGAHTWAKCDLSPTAPMYLIVEAVG